MKINKIRGGGFGFQGEDFQNEKDNAKAQGANKFGAFHSSELPWRFDVFSAALFGGYLLFHGG